MHLIEASLVRIQRPATSRLFGGGFFFALIQGQSKGKANMGGRGTSSMTARPTMPGGDGYGTPSADGSMKKAIAYHGSFAAFDNFDASFANKHHQNYGEGFYLTNDPSKATLFGDKVYTVEIAYSTDMRTAKRTGREMDFQYDAETGYWVIPHDKSRNLKILKRESEDKYKVRRR